MKITVSIIFFLFFINSCNQKPTFPLEPSITLAGISNTSVIDQFTGGNKATTKDSVSISINFRDGDGDLGISEAERKDSSNKDFNFIVKRFLRVKGKYVEFDPKPLSHSGNFITLKNSLKPGPIEGTIHYPLEFPPFKSNKKDTIKFEIQIVDRAKNKSNVVTTDSVLVFELNKDILPK